MKLLSRFLTKTDFASYEDFSENFRINVPDDFNFGFDVVDALGRESPTQKALVWHNPGGATRELTFAEMSELSNRAANWFASLGIAKGDCVMLILKRRLQYWHILCGLHKLGAIVIPATAQLTAKDVAYRCEAAKVRMLVTVDEPAVREAVEHAMEKVKVPLLAFVGDEWEGRRDHGTTGQWMTEWLNADAGIAAASPRFARPAAADGAATKASDVMLMYFTSGTAGMPKMVAHNFAYPLGHILTARYWQGCEDGGLHFTIAETGWAKASWGKVYGQWISGSAVMVYDFDRFHAPELAEVVRRFGVTTFCAPPTMYRYMIKERLDAGEWQSVRRACTAGEALNPEVFNRFKEITGLEIREGFGQSESVVLVATWPWLTPHPGSMGKPSPGHDIDLIDDDGRPCESGEEGELVVRTANGVPPGLFIEYAGDAERNAAAWRGGAYHTGDVVWRDADGYHWFKGRKDDVIKSSGYRISPFEVENAIMEHPAVLEVAVTGAPDADRGVVIKATIVLTSGFEASEALKKQIQEHVKRVTAPYKYPRVIEFVGALPKTSSGKVRRVEIRGKDSERASRLRGLRLSLGHTTAEVSQATGIDEALYLEYEDARRDLPISHLSLLSAFFHVESKVILAGEEAHARDLFVTRNGRGPVESRHHEHSFEALGTGFANKRMEPFMVVVEPDDKPLALLKHPGQEFDYIVEGSLHFQIGGRTVILQAGDNIYFDATQPHGFKALDRRPAKFLAIITANE